MNNIEALWDAEIESELGYLSTLGIGSDEHKTTVDGLTKMMDRKIELKKFDLEYELKQQQLREDKKDRLIKNIMTAAGISLPLLVTIWGTIVSLNFEKEGVVTTGAGRGFINKMFHWK